jgi:hypothetical protein
VEKFTVQFCAQIITGDVRLLHVNRALIFMTVKGKAFLTSTIFNEWFCVKR